MRPDLDRFLGQHPAVRSSLARGNRLWLREIDRVIEDGLAAEHAPTIWNPASTVFVRNDAMRARADDESIHASSMPATTPSKTERTSEGMRSLSVARGDRMDECQALFFARPKKRRSTDE